MKPLRHFNLFVVALIVLFQLYMGLQTATPAHADGLSTPPTPTPVRGTCDDMVCG